MNDKILCIHHGGCDDGFAAAWAVEKAYPGKVEHVAGVYQTMPPDCRGRDVVIVDFCYVSPKDMEPGVIMRRIAEQASSVLILDHHKTARDDCVPLMEEGVIDGEFDMDRSGAMMAWDHYHGKGKHPKIIDYVQDRDLWRFELPGSKEHSMGLRSYPQKFNVWDSLDSLDLIDEGITINRYYEARCDEVKRNVETGKIGDYHVPVCNAPWFMASDIAGDLAEGHPFAACWWQTSNGKTYSLRSREGGIDVSEVAKAYGGGGHANAAGFTIDKGVEEIVGP